MKTFLDWSAYRDAGMGDAYAYIPKTGGDFAKAVAVCINSGLCRTHNKGVMCPSYRVSEVPDHSTGGRVKLLKAALNGELGTLPFTDPALAEAMDLCVSCKGCKRECENAVDMAAIRIEYLAQRQAHTGPSLRTKLLAGLPRWLHRWPWLGKLTAWRNRTPWLAALGETWLGIAARRRLPEPAPHSFHAPAAAPESVGGTREVVLFVDTFTHYFEPDIADAALAVLNAAGYQVIVAQPAADAPEPERPLCCGRTWLAHGMIDEARAEARRVLAVLLPHAEAGRAIVGLEPACILSLRDEHKMLGLGEPALKLAQHILLFEEFIAKEHTAKAFKLDFKPADKTAPVLVHGHCHQKAVGAMKSMRKVLKLVPGLDFECIESSCCGMAGSFGLEAEHAATSLAMAELALLPKLREHPAAAAVIGNGFSCRHQIREGSGHQPKHLAQVLKEALA
ncbi:(Fe-S)-binding protein [Methylomagnum sp.]